VELLDEIDELVTSTQSTSTIRGVSGSMLCVLDPYQLVALSDTIVQLLIREQTHIDAFIISCYESTVTNETKVAFGLQLRVFLELALRFTNVPLRIQCTIHLKLSGRACCILSSSPTGQYARIVCDDKVKNSHQAVRIPIDDVISRYLQFYILQCRADLQSEYVFQSVLGKKWTTASKDIKEYLTVRGVDCDILVPNGRFVHFSRNISLAVFASHTHFNVEKLRNYALLMRHSLASIEHVYSPWIRMAQAQQAADELFRMRNHEQVEHLPSPLPVLETLRGKVQYYTNSLEQKKTRVTYVDVGVQTETYASEDLCSDTASSTCTACFSKLSLCGPIGNSKSIHFGKLYLLCKLCHPSGSLEHARYFYALGCQPAGVPTTSVKPRNLQVITEHIFSKTQKNLILF
jgi:hypothetical protein